MSDTEPFQIRDARDDDANGIIALMTNVFAEYEGCVMDVDGELPELRAIATYFAKLHGRFWVCATTREIIGCVGYSPSAEEGGYELKKLYVARGTRRSGIGSTLASLVEQAAANASRRFVDLWSDTRFVTAHRFYERRGYVRGPGSRDLHDKSDTVEFYFRREIE